VHTRRIATFLLGGWLGCSVFMAFVVLQNIHSPALVTNQPVPAVANMIKTLGQDQMTLLLRHHAAEQTRALYYLWEQGQIALGLALGGCLYFATQKRMFSMILCGIMLTLVLIQYFVITPELSFRGREADFLPAAVASATLVRTLLLYQMQVTTEGVKLVVGGILASYLFAFKTSRKRSGRREIDVVDHADDRHINR
jgi:hypothetical protein